MKSKKDEVDGNIFKKTNSEEEVDGNALKKAHLEQEQIQVTAPEEISNYVPVVSAVKEDPMKNGPSPVSNFLFI